MFGRLFGKGHQGDRLAAEAVTAYERSDDVFEVIAKLKKALALGLKTYPVDRAHVFLGAAYGDAGLHEEAQRAYESALRENPSNSTALSNLGLIHERNGDFGRCRELYERAIVAAPTNAFAHNNLGALLKKRGDLREARAALERAVELNPTLAVAHANLARCCADIGDFAAARIAFRGAARCQYDDLTGLERELRAKEAAVPPVYFDEAAFWRLAPRLLPNMADVEAELRRASNDPQGLHGELVASGRGFYAHDVVISRALPWLLLCSELTRRGLAVPGRRQELSEWIALVSRAVRERGLTVPEDALLQQEMKREAERRRRLEPDGPERDLFDFFHALTSGGDIVLLRLWETSDQALVCPLARSAWLPIDYPFTDGADGPGKIDLLAEPEPEPAAGPLN